MKRSINSRSGGFTLIELVVVMGMLGLIFAIVVAARPKNSALRLQTEAQTIVHELSRARSLAMTTNSETVILVDTKRRRINAGRSSREIPVGMNVAVTIADTERAAQSGGFRFYPDGQSSGGEIVLAMDGRQSRISVNWLTGQPRIVQ